MQALYQQAVQAHQRGHLVEATRLYRALLRQAPKHADAHHLLGVCLSQQQAHRDALRHLERAHRLQPEHPLYLNNLGEACRKLGRWHEALRHYRAAVARAPRLVTAHYNLGIALNHLGKRQEAIAHYQTALQLQPDHARAHYNLGNVFLAIGHFRSALASYQRAIQHRPDHAEAHNNLGAAHNALDETDAALAAYQQALRLRPGFAEAHRNTGLVLAKQGHTEQARQALRQALERDPDPALRLHTETLVAPIAASNAAIDVARARLHAVLDEYLADKPAFDLAGLHTAGGEPPSVLPYQGRDDRPLKEKWAAVFRGQIPQYAPKRNTEKPHIGFVVTHGHEGVFLKCMRGLIDRMPTDRFRVTVVCSEQGSPEVLGPAFENPEVRLLPLPNRVDLALPKLAAGGFDVLHYWEVGTDLMNYVLPQARCAPVQCATWGWPVTTGLGEVDFFLSCKLLETPESDAHYTEQLVRLDRLPTYYFRPPIPAHPHPRSHFGLSDDQNVYLCAQNLRKVHPDLDPLIGQILQRDPAGLVLFLADKQAHVTEMLRQRLAQGLPNVIDRVRILARMDEAAYLSLTCRADVILDTLHYGGGANTTYDAFAAGTPVVTYPTRFHRGRYAYAAYQQIGIADGIADSPEDYVERATRFGTDAAYRANVSQRIREAAPAVFEDEKAVAELTDFFADAIARSRS